MLYAFDADPASLVILWTHRLGAWACEHEPCIPMRSDTMICEEQPGYSLIRSLCGKVRMVCESCSAP